ncbi:FAD/NAD(P)-binding domain-containing protein [Ramaria rubella]|nr:FAD/NAD(P)-binding domain-containing protein [Ramaria rubella]
MYVGLSLLALLSPVQVALSNTQHPLKTSKPEFYNDPYLFSTSSEHYGFPSPIDRVAVIGAGPGGLQYAAVLLKHGFQVRLFERDTVPGGNWRYSDETPLDLDYPDKPLPIASYTPDIPPVLPFSKIFREGDDGISLSHRYRDHWLPRPIWKGMTTISPSAITRLPNIDYEEDAPWVLPQLEVQRHVRQYASAQALSPIDDTDFFNVTSYGTRVEDVRKRHFGNGSENSKWQLTLRKLTQVQEDGRPGLHVKYWTEEFDAVVVATGPYDSPHVPPIKGLADIAQKSKQIYHSRRYRRPEHVSGKNVLIVGNSFSGSGIARDIIYHAKSVTVSARHHSGPPNPIAELARSLTPHNATFVPEIAEFKSLEEIHLINGTILSEIDEVILATGFRRSNPFLVDYHNATFSGKPYDFEVAPILTDGKSIHSLTFSGHYIDDPTLVFGSGVWMHATLQGTSFARVWKGAARLPVRETLWNEYYAREGGRHSTLRLFGLPVAEVVYRRLVTWINNESYLHGGTLVKLYPIELREIFLNFMAANGLPPGFITRDTFTKTDNTPAYENLITLGYGVDGHNGLLTWNEGAEWDDGHLDW